MTKQLQRGFIERTLDLYQSQSIAVLDAAWDADCLRASLRLLPYSFAKPGHLEYMTASMATLYVSQLGYLAARFMITEHLLPRGVAVTDEDFFAARDNGDLVYSTLRARFRQKILNALRTIPAVAKLDHAHARGGYIATTLNADLNNGASIVTGTLVMPIPRQ